MKIKIKANPKIVTNDQDGSPNGFLIPIYNTNDDFFGAGAEPQQVYLTVVAHRKVKGPHLHHIRTGCFTCVKGNARFVLKVGDGYETFYSGEDHDYRSVIVPKGTAALLQNIGDDDAYVLNMPSPAWTPTMNDEHSADFSDFDLDAF